MGLLDLLNKKEEVVAIEIEPSAVRLMEISDQNGQLEVRRFGSKPLPEKCINNNIVVDASRVAEVISSLAEECGISTQRVTTAIPGASVFTKRIKMPQASLRELDTNIQFEAGNFVPHNITAVQVDYHIIGESSKGQLDVLVAAVKNEVLDSYLSALALAGLDTAVVDVDYFALQNCFEICYPSSLDETSALVHLGSKFASVNIVRSGISLFAGDISISSQSFIDALKEVFGIPEAEAANLAFGDTNDHQLKEASEEILSKQSEQVAVELNRQLSFFWNASGADGSIDKIYLSGAASKLGPLKSLINVKTGVTVESLNIMNNLSFAEGISKDNFENEAQKLGILVGLAIRQPGDRIIPDFM